ncbi:TIGR03560 family F420-dependent LLM class oxidoreductase [Kineococcus rubinsiae]|uniref:TIGR03560 family F420-dependent LLM class oxidoreductase n=1 Tax=Kineococcus rubinsiae TaxID=2609562 RepID=UPI001431A46C|nr:TIGR03560 family F420-dependent LLM class oxidoreductase [Kineococcus rubinsiae]
MDVRGRPLHVGIQLQAQRTSWGEFSEALLAVEELGFDSAWTFDHLLPFSGADDGAAFETLTTLAAMATLTSRVRIGVLVAGVLYRDPATLAKSAALVDHISGGRLEFSLGAAWAEREFDAYGLPFPPLAERYERLEEALQIVGQLWSRPRTTFEGRHYRLHDAPCEPKPLQSPHPPITLGGSGLGTLRIAARHADRWNAQGSAEKCAERAARLERCCEEVGRDFGEIELSVHPSVSVAATREEAEANAARTAAGHGADLAQQRDRWLIGTPDDVVRQLREFTDRGFSHFVFGVGHPFDLTPLRLLREEVVPALG